MAFEASNIQDISGAQMIKIPDNFKINDDKVYLKKGVEHAIYYSVSQPMAVYGRQT